MQCLDEQPNQTPLSSVNKGVRSVGRKDTFWGNTCSSAENAEEDGGGIIQQPRASLKSLYEGFGSEALGRMGSPPQLAASFGGPCSGALPGALQALKPLPSPFVLLFQLDFTWVCWGPQGSPHPGSSHPVAEGHFCGGGNPRKDWATSMETKACFQTVRRETVSILGL